MLVPGEEGADVPQGHSMPRERSGDRVKGKRGPQVREGGGWGRERAWGGLQAGRKGPFRGVGRERGSAVVTGDRNSLQPAPQDGLWLEDVLVTNCVGQNNRNVFVVVSSANEGKEQMRRLTAHRTLPVRTVNRSPFRRKGNNTHPRGRALGRGQGSEEQQ